MYRFTRHPHLYAPKMVAIELTFTNTSTEEITVIKIGSKVLTNQSTVFILVSNY